MITTPRFIALVLLLVAASSAHAFTIEKYRLGMSKQEVASKLGNCAYIRSENAYRCRAASGLPDVVNVEVMIGARNNKLVGITYWLVYDKTKPTKYDVQQALGIPVCPAKDTSRSSTRMDDELCLGGSDRIRIIGPSITPGSNRSIDHGSTTRYWAVSASYSPETNRLQRKDINRALNDERRSKAFNRSLK